MKQKRIAALLALLLALFLPATAFAAESDDIVSIQWKKISGKDFYVDELDGVKAYPQYQCNDFAIRYYQEVLGVDMFVGSVPPFLIENWFSEETGFVITDEPKKGDIAYWPMERRGLPYAHTAIVKSYEDGVLTLIEQNWNWNNSASYQRKVKYPSENYDVYTLDESAKTDTNTQKSGTLRLKGFKKSATTETTAAESKTTSSSTKKATTSKSKTLTSSTDTSKSTSGKKLTLKK